MLATFVRRGDLADLAPFVVLEVRPRDPIADVLQCLAALKVATPNRVDPELYRTD